MHLEKCLLLLLSTKVRGTVRNFFAMAVQEWLLSVVVCRLFVEKIKKHPGYAKVSATDKARVKKLLKSAFDGAMELKDKLKEKYDKEKNVYTKKQQEIVRPLNLVALSVIEKEVVNVCAAF